MKALSVAICGVAGFNRGDDAIALAIAQGIRTHSADASIRIAVLAPVDLGAPPAVRTFMAARSHPTGLLGLFLAIARSDLVVLGGGSLIQDKFGGDRVKGVMGYAWLVSWLAARMGKRLVTAPLGVDALHSLKAKQVAGEILGRCRQVNVRDERSRSNALAFARPGSSTPRCVPDPVFGLAGTPQPIAPGAPFVLAPAFEGEYDDFVADVFAQVAAGCLAATDRPVVLIAMDHRPDQDAGKLPAIVERLPADLRARVRTIVPRRLDETVALLRTSAGIGAMRLHAMILGYGFAPVACLSRTTKTDAFMEDFHVPGVSVEQALDTAAVASSLIDGMLNWPGRERQQSQREDNIRELDRFYADLAGTAQSAKK